MNIETDIHADDYGYSLKTSEDIIECMKEGCLDSISIICNTSWFQESMELLYKTIPDLPFLPCMSVHLNLPEGDCHSDLLPMSWEKLFFSSFGLKNKELKDDIKKELKRQIDITQAAIKKCMMIAKENNIPCQQKGVRLDSHVHTHLIPVVWKSLIEVVEEENYDIEYIRNPKEPLEPFMKEKSLWSTYSLINIVKNRILMAYSGSVDKYYDSHGIKKMYMCGLMMSGHMDLERIQKIFPRMLSKAEKDGRKLEILFHPGKAAKEEFHREMNEEYFNNFNSSDNRIIEKHTVLNMKTKGESYGKEERK